jgi:CheY-like chemotaxis protein/anti-sigma regulatory factor (Ser/Thr protein kinase)
MADQRRLKQILLNLLSNAIKYNRVGGRVSVLLETTAEGRVCIVVSDTGPGIAAGDLDRLFAPFDRLGAEATNVEGTGLGLVLSKRLAEAMGGSLEVSTELGHGSAFTVELARAEAVALTEALEGDTPSVPVGDRADGRTATVLYVEDNAANLILVQRVITRRPGLQLISAMEGAAGVDLALAEAPDMVLLDLHLPDIPGREVLRRLRADVRTRDTPVVVLSADATPGQVQRLLAAGANAYLTKPLDVREFLRTIDAVLGIDKEVRA